MNPQEQLTRTLSKKLDKKLVEDLVKEYRTAKQSNRVGDWPKAILHAGRFSELALAAVQEWVDKSSPDLNKLSFQPMFEDLTSRPKANAEDDIMLLAIPRAAMSIYTIRNKKAVAHVKAVNPDFIDATFCLSTCDWILSEFVLVLCRADPKKAKNLIDGVIEKELPFIEEFEGGEVMVLKADWPFVNNILAVLYHFYPERVTNIELGEHLKVKYPQRLTTDLARLEQRRLIHRNSEGSTLTKAGLVHFESLLAKS